MKIAVIILAGGKSSRMGIDKSLLEINGISMLQHTINRLDVAKDLPKDLPKDLIETIAINANGDANRFGDIGFEIFPDSMFGFGENFAGPLAGILAGMEWVKNSSKDVSHIITIPVDSIFFPKTLIAEFCIAINSGAEILLAASNGKTHPVFAMWDLKLAKDLKQFLGNQTSRKIMDFVNRHKWHKVEFKNDDKLDPFFNINEKTDLELAKRYLK